MLLYCKNKPKTFNWCRCYCRDEAFSEYFIRTCTVAQYLVCDMILGMDKKKTLKRDDKLLGLIGVLSGTSMLHEGQSQSRAKLEPTQSLSNRRGFQTRFKHGYERKLSRIHGQTFF